MKYYLIKELEPIAMATIFVKFLLPWQPSEDILLFFEIKTLNFNTIIYNPQSFRNIGKSLHWKITV